MEAIIIKEKSIFIVVIMVSINNISSGSAHFFLFRARRPAPFSALRPWMALLPLSVQADNELGEKLKIIEKL
jgi:hypothetical protein